MMRDDGLPKGRAAGLVAPVAALALAGLTGCNPYDEWSKNEEGLGVVDPVTFPAASLGTGGSRTQPGIGVFQETHAFADGAELGYFPYAYPSMPTAASLRVRDNNAANPRVPTIGTFIFDATGAPPSPLPAMQKCSPPSSDYRYDEVRDEVHYDEQGSVFAALPRATYNMGEASTTTYLPIVTEWTATAAGQPCQRFKSSSQTEGAMGRMPSGRFAAWWIIDPAAAVYKFSDDPDMDPRGLDLQKWGWFNRYLLAYLDGGYIPTTEMTVTENGVTKPVVVMTTQKLYYPRTILRMDANGMLGPGPGARSSGYDVLQFKRGAPGYTPVCQVFTYETPAPVAPEQLPKSVGEIEGMYAATIMPAAVPYVFCLQVR